MRKLPASFCVDDGNEAPGRWDETLNAEQERAACYNDYAKALLVLAGAGCGKTKTLIARALFLHRELNIPELCR